MLQIKHLQIEVTGELSPESLSCLNRQRLGAVLSLVNQQELASLTSLPEVIKIKQLTLELGQVPVSDFSQGFISLLKQAVQQWQSRLYEYLADYQQRAPDANMRGDVLSSTQAPREASVVQDASQKDVPVQLKALLTLIAQVPRQQRFNLALQQYQMHYGQQMPQHEQQWLSRFLMAKKAPSATGLTSNKGVSDETSACLRCLQELIQQQPSWPERPQQIFAFLQEGYRQRTGQSLPQEAVQLVTEYCHQTLNGYRPTEYNTHSIESGEEPATWPTKVHSGSLALPGFRLFQDTTGDKLTPPQSNIAPLLPQGNSSSETNTSSETSTSSETNIFSETITSPETSTSPASKWLTTSPPPPQRLSMDSGNLADTMDDLLLMLAQSDNRIRSLQQLIARYEQQHSPTLAADLTQVLAHYFESMLVPTDEVLISGKSKNLCWPHPTQTGNAAVSLNGQTDLVEALPIRRWLALLSELSKMSDNNNPAAHKLWQVIVAKQRVGDSKVATKCPTNKGRATTQDRSANPDVRDNIEVKESTGELLPVATLQHWYQSAYNKSLPKKLLKQLNEGVSNAFSESPALNAIQTGDTGIINRNKQTDTTAFTGQLSVAEQGVKPAEPLSGTQEKVGQYNGHVALVEQLQQVSREGPQRFEQRQQNLQQAPAEKPSTGQTHQTGEQTSESQSDSTDSTEQQIAENIRQLLPLLRQNPERITSQAQLESLFQQHCSPPLSAEIRQVLRRYFEALRGQSGELQKPEGITDEPKLQPHQAPYDAEIFPRQTDLNQAFPLTNWLKLVSELRDASKNETGAVHKLWRVIAAKHRASDSRTGAASVFNIDKTVADKTAAEETANHPISFAVVQHWYQSAYNKSLPKKLLKQLNEGVSNAFSESPALNAIQTGDTGIINRNTQTDTTAFTGQLSVAEQGVKPAEPLSGTQEKVGQYNAHVALVEQLQQVSRKGPQRFEQRQQNLQQAPAEKPSTGQTHQTGEQTSESQSDSTDSTEQQIAENIRQLLPLLRQNPERITSQAQLESLYQQHCSPPLSAEIRQVLRRYFEALRGQSGELQKPEGITDEPKLQPHQAPYDAKTFPRQTDLNQAFPLANWLKLVSELRDASKNETGAVHKLWRVIAAKQKGSDSKETSASSVYNGGAVTQDHVITPDGKDKVQDKTDVKETTGSLIYIATIKRWYQTAYNKPLPKKLLKQLNAAVRQSYAESLPLTDALSMTQWREHFALLTGEYAGKNAAIFRLIRALESTDDHLENESREHGRARDRGTEKDKVKRTAVQNSLSGVSTNPLLTVADLTLLYLKTYAKPLPQKLLKQLELCTRQSLSKAQRQAAPQVGAPRDSDAAEQLLMGPTAARYFANKTAGATVRPRNSHKPDDCSDAADSGISESKTDQRYSQPLPNHALTDSDSPQHKPKTTAKQSAPQLSTERLSTKQWSAEYRLNDIEQKVTDNAPDARQPLSRKAVDGIQHVDANTQKTHFQVYLKRLQKTHLREPQVLEAIIPAAGIICAWVLWQRQFSNQHWLAPTGEFNSDETANLAANWLLQVADAELTLMQPLLSLLCGLAPDALTLLSSEQLQQGMAEDLTQSLTAHKQLLLSLWPVLKPEQLAELQTFFMARNGILSPTPVGYELTMVPEPFDALMQSTPLPWPVSTIRLPWMTQTLEVQWT